MECAILSKFMNTKTTLYTRKTPDFIGVSEICTAFLLITFPIIIIKIINNFTNENRPFFQTFKEPKANVVQLLRLAKKYSNPVCVATPLPGFLLSDIFNLKCITNTERGETSQEK